MDIEGNRFLVIGGAGFIGSHVVDLLLAKGARHVRIYDNFSRGTRANIAAALQDTRVEVFADGGEILHKDTLCAAMKDVDGVFHLAALWLLQCQQYPRSAFDVNVGGTMNVVEACIANQIKRLVFSSSASVYGDAVSEPIEEDHPLNCQEFYGASKVCGEMVLRALVNNNSSAESVFDHICLRYMNVYGPRQDAKGAYLGVIVRMLNALDEGRNPVIHGDGSQAYDFVDVRDCAVANILAMQSTTSNRCYNVGTGVKTSIKELACRVAAIHPSGIEACFEPSNRFFVQSRVGSIQRAQQDLQFTANIDLDTGLRNFIHWRAIQNKEIAL